MPDSPEPFDREHTVRMLVLNAVCDDYENIDQIIHGTVAKECQPLGWRIERYEILNALEWLVAEGLATAHNLGLPRDATLMSRMPTLLQSDNPYVYFFVTEAGRNVQQAYTAWPFDVPE